MHKVAIRKNSTNETRVCEFPGDWGESSDFLWTDGNLACDDNRHIFFQRAANEEKTDWPQCSTTEYSVIYVELPDGTRFEVEDYEQL